LNIFLDHTFTKKPLITQNKQLGTNQILITLTKKSPKSFIYKLFKIKALSEVTLTKL